MSSLTLPATPLTLGSQDLAEVLALCHRLEARCPTCLLLLAVLSSGSLDGLSQPSHLRKVFLALLSLSEAERADVLAEASPLGDALTRLWQRKDLFPFQTTAGRSSSSPSVGRPLDLVSLIAFSACPLWTQQRDFYRRLGLRAWDGPVPCRISSNPFVAALYVDEITRILHFPCLDGTSTPRVCIVEVGAGHGKLSYLMAQEFNRRFNEDIEFTVIATDFHDEVFKDLKTLPWTQKCNRLHFAVIATSTDEGSTAYDPFWDEISKEPFDALCIVANYAFDSMPVDLFCSSTKGDILEIGYHTSGEYLVVNYGKSVAKAKLPQSFVNHLWKFPGQLQHFPVEGMRTLFSIKKIFQSVSNISLICGDVLLASDHKSWRCDSICELDEGDRSIFDLDPPFISPSKDALAMPVSKDVVEIVFKECFGECRLLSSTHPFSSSFGVFTLQSVPKAQKEYSRFQLFYFIPFGPHEFQILAEAVENYEQLFSLRFMHSFIGQLSGFDPLRLIELMWRVKPRLTTGDFPTWLELAKQCLERHYSSSWSEYLLLRRRIGQWMIACGEYRAALVLYEREGMDFNSRSLIRQAEWLNVGSTETNRGLLTEYDAYLAAVCLFKLNNLLSCQSLLQALVNLLRPKTLKSAVLLRASRLLRKVCRRIEESDKSD